MHIKYQNIKFQSKSLEKIDRANEIIEEYENDGYSLTLRQLYYQFVARGFIPNNQKSYDNLGKIINNARLAGLISWDSIEDRTRYLQGYTTWRNPAEILRESYDRYKEDLWENQPYNIEVWVEKQALEDVISKACSKYRINYFSCRGYVSQSAMWQASQRYLHLDKDTIIIHLGDHDPSGIDMTRDIESRLVDVFEINSIYINRIALNIDQVNKYKPPINPAKLTDSRAKDYVSKFGYNSWELDALEPKLLVNLIQSKIEDFLDLEQWGKDLKVEKTNKEKIKNAIENLNNHIEL